VVWAVHGANGLHVVQIVHSTYEKSCDHVTHQYISIQLYAIKCDGVFVLVTVYLMIKTHKQGS